jgi:hypothetical protein
MERDILKDITVESDIHVDIPEHATYLTFSEDEQNIHFQDWLYSKGLELYKKYYEEVTNTNR